MPPRVTVSLIELCLFRRGPQDLPYRPPLALACLLATVLVELYTNLRIGEPMGLVIPTVLASALFALVATRLVLRLAGHEPRYWQTLLALAGSGLLFAAVAAPVRIAIGPIDPAILQGSALPPTAYMIVALMGLWRLAVIGHIWRHALQIRLPVGILVGLGLFLLEMALIVVLFAPVVSPSPASGA